MMEIGLEFRACEMFMASWNSYQNIAASRCDSSGHQYSIGILVSNSMSVPFNYMLFNHYDAYSSDS